MQTERKLMAKKNKTRKGNFTDRIKTQIAWDCKDICAYLECDKKLIRTKITIDQENAGWFQGHFEIRNRY